MPQRRRQGRGLHESFGVYNFSTTLRSFSNPKIQSASAKRSAPLRQRNAMGHPNAAASLAQPRNSGFAQGLNRDFGEELGEGEDADFGELGFD